VHRVGFAILLLARSSVTEGPTQTTRIRLLTLAASYVEPNKVMNDSVKSGSSHTQRYVIASLSTWGVTEHHGCVVWLAASGAGWEGDGERKQTAEQGSEGVGAGRGR
jgi:hypothetical protein